MNAQDWKDEANREATYKVIDAQPKCATCGSTRFVFYHTITEAADVSGFDADGAAIVGDAKWEVTDAIDSEIRCENGHALKCSESGPWTGDVTVSTISTAWSPRRTEVV